MNPQLWLIGTPLDESTPLSAPTLDLLERCSVLIGESRRVAQKWTSKRPDLAKKTWFFLDGIRPNEEKDLRVQLQHCFQNGENVALFSDGGMPVLFDPGSDILTRCRELGFHVRTLAGATSWGTACVVSGWEPPFLILGFLPRKTEERARLWDTQKKRKEHIVLMDTPYRFPAIIDLMEQSLEPDRPVFVAWEIGTHSETFLWTRAGHLRRQCNSLGLSKGEFILIVGA